MQYSFSIEECEEIINISKDFEKRHASAVLEVGGEVVKILHEFYNIKIERNSKTQWIFDRFKTYMDTKFPSNKINLMDNITCNVFPEGCNLDKHIDAEQQEGVIRICGVKLNEDYEGGEFILYNPTEILNTSVGQIYDLDVTGKVHEIKKVTKGERISLVVFLTKEILNIKPALF